jgi:predicted RNase H-like HicB family nuclease
MYFLCIAVTGRWALGAARTLPIHPVMSCRILLSESDGAIWRQTGIKDQNVGYSAYVPELPTILVTGRSMDELAARAKEAIVFYWTALQAYRSPTSLLKEIEVDLPA